MSVYSSQKFPSQFLTISLPLLQSSIYQYNGIDNIQASEQDFLQMFGKLGSQEINEFYFTMAHIYNCDVKIISEYSQNLLSQQQTIITNSNSEVSCYHLENNSNLCIKRQTDKVLQNQMVLKSALITVLNEIGQKISENIIDKDLCIIVNEVVRVDKDQQFWNKVSSLIPSKSKKQVYDFYRISFSKILYDENITKDDTKMIRQLNKENKNTRPAVLAEIFLERTGKNILKRDVIMQFVNIRRQEQLNE
ncbi:Hypothetical_protein [Hexamita inflata]|uniref:Hypothetical_protein n=1 Tax=Hexamita inflata TaxID=28002 RepID=A0AA86UDV9_9EUKA|nr:Hypothetical protein HINF_LOCUS41925 [Hexamita inflata]